MTKQIKALSQQAHSRIGRVKRLLHQGPVAWGIIFVLVALYLAPNFLPGMNPTMLAPLVPLSFVIIIVAVLLRARRGGLLAWSLLTAGSFLGDLWSNGFSLSIPGLTMTTAICLSTLLLTLAAGHFRHMSQQLKLAQAALLKQALTDALTGLPNHRAVMDQLSKEVDRAQRYHRPLSILFFDADRFKHVNDTHGHSAGDAVLCQIGKRAAGVLHGGDTLGRFGGEEFVVLLPEADTHEASAMAERIRSAVAASTMASAEVEEGILMTVSIGVATYLDDADTQEALLQQADEAMYLSKRLGRNQVRMAKEARSISANPELMLLLQESERGEARERRGQSPQQVKEDYILKMISSLQFLVERRDPTMNEHSQRVSVLAGAIAQELALPEQDIFLTRTAALLHDIGKVSLPDTLLQKPGHLTLKDRARLREHPELGAQILQTNPFLHSLIPGVLHHHECWDGTGYPDQLKGRDIPLSARIIGVAEAYDTMQREHPYQGSLTQKKAMAELQCSAGTQFDPTVVQALATVFSEPQRYQLSLQEVGH